MAKEIERTGKLSVREHFSAFIQSNRHFLLAGIAAVFVLIVGFVVVSEIRSYREQKSVTLVENAQQQYTDWQTAPAAKKKDLETKLLANLDNIIKKYPSLYSAQRALFIRGNLYYDKKEWKLAAESYVQLAHKFSQSYLAPISLLDAGAAYEEAGDNSAAATQYSLIAEKYGSHTPEKPLALFSLGRLAEEKKDYSAAKTQYDKLVNDFPGSGWTNLARDRIIYLQVKGLIPTKQS
ncbi:MAG TPA: tetratricopeptide repeat protein [Spirochaetia bacterium]|nr:tetratricopeptide repeat protein [Spirochaetia bacterium]